MKYWNSAAEWAAKKAGVDIDSYEAECRPYAEIVHKIALMYRRMDIGAMEYQILIDRDKHAAHNRVIIAIEKLEAELRRLGLQSIYEGQLANGRITSRQEAGKFAMEFCGFAIDSDFAN